MSKLDLMEYKKQVQGGKSNKDKLIKKRRIAALNAEIKEEKERNAKKMQKTRDDKARTANKQEFAYMYQNLICWVGWIKLQNHDKLARGNYRIPRLPEGLNFLYQRWSTKDVLQLTAFASDWQWNRIIPV